MFSSEIHRKIMSKKGNTVDSQAIIVRQSERYGDNSGKRERRMGMKINDRVHQLSGSV